MHILVLSDSHGKLDNMTVAVKRERPRMIFHLGDCWRDAESLHDRFPEIPLAQVPGNCDFCGSLATEKLVLQDGFRILLCHGHTYGVKQSLLTAGYAAEAQKLDAFLFGHTHRPLVDRRSKTLFLNPGSIGDYRFPTYAVLCEKSGMLDGRTVQL